MTDQPARVPPAGPPVLAFSNRRSEDFAVTTPDGVVARMDVSLLTSAFGIFDAHGERLCAGVVVFGSFGRRWAVTDASGAPLLELGVGWGRTTTVRFADGRTGEVRGRLFSREWSMVDERGGTVLHAAPTTNAWGFQSDAWVVQQDGTLGLAQFVAVVETHRRVVQRRRGGGAA